MSPTRREFVALAAAGLALTVLNNVVRGEDDPQAPTEAFLAGPLSQYAKAGVYDKFFKDKQVLLVSDGKELVALSTICPHAGGQIRWSKDKKEFTCDKHKAHFTAEGVNIAGGKAKRPMERYAIRLAPNDQTQVQVDPKRVLRKDKEQWGDPEASVKF